MSKASQKGSGKRADPGSSTSDDQHRDEGDELYLELLDRIRVLEDKEQAQTTKMNDLQTQLDQAHLEIFSLRTKVSEFIESLEYTQKEQDDIIERVETCEEDQIQQEKELTRQNIYSRRWNLILHGTEERQDENCTELVQNAMTTNLKIAPEKSQAMMFCGVHRLGNKKPNATRPRPVIARFTCRADMDFVWRQRHFLKESMIKLAEDLPKSIRDVRKKILVLALKKACQGEGNKASIVGDRLIVNRKRYSANEIPKRWKTDKNTGKENSAQMES